VDQVFVIHHRLSDIKKWSIQIGELKWLDRETRKGVQRLLNHIYSDSVGFRLDEVGLYYVSPARK
jgi:hypothetical protein